MTVCFVLTSCLKDEHLPENGVGIIGAVNRLKAGGTLFFEKSIDFRDLHRVVNTVTNLNFVSLPVDKTKYPTKDRVYQRLLRDGLLIEFSCEFEEPNNGKMPKIRWIAETTPTMINEEDWMLWNSLIDEIRHALHCIVSEINQRKPE